MTDNMDTIYYAIIDKLNSEARDAIIDYPSRGSNMRVEPIAPMRISDYANRNGAIRNVGYYVQVLNGRFYPVVYGKTRDSHESAWSAMHEAKKLAEKIAGSMRSRGIRARAVQIHNIPLGG